MGVHRFYLSLFLCIGAAPLISSAIDCNTYNPLICQPDLLQFCFTDGTLIQGSCEASHMVCNESKVIDESFASCQSSDTFNCTGYSSIDPCLPDLIEYCFTNGEKVVGTCAAKSKYCVDNLEIDASGNSCEDPSIDCDNHDPNEICRPDLVEYCLSDGRKIAGLCQAGKIVCSEDVTLDLTGLACAKVDCGRYNATQQCNSADKTEYCLGDGPDHIAVGECEALAAICLNGKEPNFEEGGCSACSQISKIPALLVFIIYIIYNV
ncbi:hypothetical protein LOTGIDRAFT_154481 [Lottia gigantea]|uniref:Uncharacterized protein n=1 Tax=Lottia gigantea TaxID=225164 RepID=V3ZE50_LOTGI|nr:hypothetical protein LOTGIDRAFT_154481 [Lottia gigantea]ESO89373.1 hypothetical protein LOTGIDRAFT_154481 [Lottia gigantea]